MAVQRNGKSRTFKAPKKNAIDESLATTEVIGDPEGEDDHTNGLCHRLRSLEDLLRRTAPAELDKAPTIEVQGPPVGWANSALVENQAALDVSPSRWQGEPRTLAQAGNIDVAGPRPTSPNQDNIFVGGTPNDDVLGLDTAKNLAHSVASATPRVSLSPSTTNQISPDEPLAHETYQPLYPFLDEDTVVGYLEQLYTTQVAGAHSLPMPSLAEVEASLSPFHSVQICLVIAFGARILEMRLATEFSSERYFATAMQRIGNLPLHDSIEGLQIMLLLTLTSFSFESGPNAWFLTSNIIASCLDLGGTTAGAAPRSSP
ncbi:hypothetical protein MRS44_005441 [Fusarium solani]|uniref:uncharacterized protein n=1 Tax=Fusarium solani TaxID=169388 RepID=UPI0032C48AA1|nr:hypothetical protein MRS44_005441 [Fusarium solani]